MCGVAASAALPLGAELVCDFGSEKVSGLLVNCVPKICDLDAARGVDCCCVLGAENAGSAADAEFGAAATAAADAEADAGSGIGVGGSLVGTKSRSTI